MRTSLFAILALGACGDRSALAPTVTTGVWGQAQRPCDAKDCMGAPIPGTQIQAFVEAVTGPIVSTTTADDGSYDLSLPPGGYELCANGASEPDPYNCTTVMPSAALPLIRVDWIDTMGWYSCTAEDC